LCMAATHDIELAEILAELYENYHFQEHITDDDITFDYILYPGKTGTRNAIQLLRLMGYPPEIVEKAHNNARRFLDTGAWR
jgi:DNA mismatch repair ATPase MutS